ncbi:XRE family transcriptional regulator [Streptomyces europaeiscabiei]|uniref:XRE family transcriptional regulator n=1 Tax=Streptomyces europaeiscabiei TaxID=146819 RepID=UPI0029B65227|nr:XRE family transcriptional regulator [Streptomyces europaeiscabiei]MDX3587298.1 XRE family transcriptional regulator [Streptomyces europaeiscabiei]MDX3634362.1 XRE family transcriptional regulator [Streptomyces europaeiscabiei]MDX3651790.1 XRE family transcriptional regulator [Streptomyces europaeiscabiei]
METQDTPPVEDFAQALAALKAEYQVSDSDIARAIGVSSAAVGTWVHRQKKPRRASVVALAQAYPKFTEERLFAALGRERPGPLSKDAEGRLLELFRELTAEQQEMKEIEMRAIAERNRSQFS